MDFNGRVFTLSLEVDECKFQILNLYAPNPDTKAESEDFFMNLQYYLYASLPAIICDDMVENLTEDRKGGVTSSSQKETIFLALQTCKHK